MPRLSHSALSKNICLQRHLCEKRVEINRACKAARRRLDCQEEEYISCLYKLLLESKLQQQADGFDVLRDDRDKPTSRVNQDKPKSRVQQHNPECLSKERCHQDNVRSSICKSANGRVSAKQFDTNVRCTSGTCCKCNLKCADHVSDRQNIATPRPQSVFDLSYFDGESDIQRRPTTSVPIRTFTQSYSFKTNGMDIAKNRRDRFLLSRKVVKREQEVVVERRHQTISDMFQDVKSNATTEELAADQERKSNSIISTGSKPIKSSTEQKQGLNNDITSGQLKEREPNLGTTSQLRAHVNTQRSSVTPDGKPDSQRVMAERDKAMCQRDNTCKAHYSKQSRKGEQENISGLDNEPEFSVSHFQEVTTLKPNFEANDESVVVDPGEETGKTVCVDFEPDRDAHSSHQSHKNRSKHSGRDTSRQLTENKTNDIHALQKQVPSRSASSRRSERRSISKQDDNTLQQSTEKSQAFLTQYAKRSKMFGYVVKTKASSVAPRDTTKKTARSPCVTYQELALIKSNINLHESRTRLILKRSARIMRYVENLVETGENRRAVNRLGVSSVYI